MARKLLRKTRAALALGLLAVTGPAAAQDPAATDRPSLLLMGTIPIYWGEVGDLSDLINGGATPHWARPQLERRFALVPVDTLSADTLPPDGVLLLAQPRTLSAPENVALDAWVRAGGHVLLFADPLMTGESRFNLGDRRRPQDVALLSPLLNHWGLDLQLADGQQPGLRNVPGERGAIPVNLAGVMTATDGSGCAISYAGLVATCRLQRGLAVVVADAALLDIAGPWPGAAESLDSLLSTALGEVGEPVHDVFVETTQYNNNNGLGEGPPAAPAPAVGVGPPR